MRWIGVVAVIGGVAAGAVRAEPGCHTVPGGGLRYCVTSVLPGQSGNSYGPEHLADGSEATAWCEGVAGRGEGQGIVLDIDGGGVLFGLNMANGYQKSQRVFSRNGRLRLIRLRSASGLDMQVALEDRMGMQRVALPPAAYRQITVEVLSVYAGSKWDDTCLSGLTPVFEGHNPGAGGGISAGEGKPGFGRFPKLRN